MKWTFSKLIRKYLNIYSGYYNLVSARSELISMSEHQIFEKIIILFIIVLVLLSGCVANYYLDAPVSDEIMFVDDNQDSDLGRVEDGGLAGSAGECPT